MINFAGLEGDTEEGERTLMLVLEMPQRVSFGGRRLEQKEVERVHLEKYRVDLLTATGVLPFDGVTEGETPDFEVTTVSGKEGIECAALTLPRRRHAFGLFTRFQQRLLEEARGKPFPYLADCGLFVWFGQGGDLPPKEHHQVRVDRLVKALREAQVDRAAIAASAQQGLPESLPVERIIDAGDAGGANIAAVCEPGSLHSDLAQAAGFDVQLHMSLPVNAADVQDEFTRVVERHDQEGVDRLLVSVSAPNRDGLIFPTESVVVNRFPPHSVPTRHIRAVTVHDFLSGTAREVA